MGYITYSYEDDAIVIREANGYEILIRGDSSAFLEFARKMIKKENDMIELASSDRITQIKAIRSIYGLGLKEAKDLLERIELGVRARVSTEAAEAEAKRNLDYPENPSLGDLLRIVEARNDDFASRL